MSLTSRELERIRLSSSGSFSAPSQSNESEARRKRSEQRTLGAHATTLLCPLLCSPLSAASFQLSRLRSHLPLAAAAAACLLPRDWRQKPRRQRRRRRQTW